MIKMIIPESAPVLPNSRVESKGIGSLMMVQGPLQRMQALAVMLGLLMERYGILIARIAIRLLP